MAENTQNPESINDASPSNGGAVSYPEAVDAELDRRPYGPTQDDAADLFAAAFGHEIKWVQDNRAWYICSRTSRPGYWSKENREGAQVRMRAVGSRLATANPDRAAQLTSMRFVRDALALTKSTLAVTPDVFNADPILLGTVGSVVNLHDGSAEPVRPELMLTQSASVEFDPDASCPNWLDHLRVLTRTDEDRDAPGDTEVIDFLQELVGVSLLGAQHEHCFIYLYGIGGRNGKGIFVETLKAVLGDYADVLDQTVLSARADAHTSPILDLRGKRFVYFDEGDGRKAINTALMKRLTGGGTVKARAMRQDNVTFAPSHTLWMTANHEPNFGIDADDAVWERVIIIPTGPTVPESQRVPDEKLRSALLAEGPGILAWAVAGAVRYLRRGKLPTKPARVRLATETLAQESRLMRRFLEEACTADPDERVLLAEFRKRYAHWLETEGELPKEGITSRYVGGLLREEKVRVDAGTGNQKYVFGWRVPGPADELMRSF